MTGLVVLDASAILAVIMQEAGAGAVLEAMEDWVVSAYNLGEVVSKLSERGMSEAQIDVIVAPFMGNVRAVTVEQARQAGLWRVATKARGLSMGDRCCLALAGSLGAVALTADRAWAGLDIGVLVEVIG